METLVEDYQSFRFDHVNADESTGGNFLTPDSDLITSEPSPASGSSSDGETSPKDYTGDFSNTPLLKFIAEMLMDEGEDLTAQPCMLADCLALQAAEKSFYDVIGQNYPDQSPLPCSSSEDSSVLTMAKKSAHHQREYLGEEGRASKQAAVFSTDSSELYEIFDEVLLCPNPGKEDEEEEEEKEKVLGREKPKKVQRKKKTRDRKRGSEKAREVVDLWSLLTQCAQAVAGYDHASTAQLLAQIRRHSSPDGDSTERLAHYFANGLEARFSAGTPQYRPLGSNGASAYDILKAYQVFIKACPFKRMSNFYANRTIAKLAEQATTIHIIDFGILYGYQWPCLIQKLSERVGGPPRVRITGIELPQPGFRPAERVEQTARRLENYCRRFNVEFECRVIAKKWEEVGVEELGVERRAGEVTVVNCLYRMENLLDDTVVEEDCPRDAVLRLVRRVDPDLFIQGVASGSHSAPFFLTRFREAMFHFSALFDMFEASLGRGDVHRGMFEREVFGRDVMNVVACEGPQRVERPETYRQWQARNVRAGLRQVGLDGGLANRVKGMVRRHYHRDFVVDRDGDWLLQGWKGRIFHAISCWRAA